MVNYDSKLQHPLGRNVYTSAPPMELAQSRSSLSSSPTMDAHPHNSSITARRSDPRHRTASPSTRRNARSLSRDPPPLMISPPSQSQRRTQQDPLESVPTPLLAYTSSLSSASSDGEQTLICDYDLAATKLYRQLEDSDWDAVTHTIQTSPKQVRTWIVRRDAKSRQKLRWKLLPLHAAVIFEAPLTIVKALVDHYTDALLLKDDQGLLPLHLAFRQKRKNEALLVFLLERAPSAVHVRDTRDRSPLDHGMQFEYSAAFLQVYAKAASQAATTTDPKEPTVSLTDHETKLKTLRALYEERMQLLRNQKEQSVQQAQLSHEAALQQLQTEHHQEMNELRDLLSQEVSKESRLQSSHDRQVADWQGRYERLRHEHAEVKLQFEDSQKEWMELLQELSRVNHKLQATAAQQRLELKEAHTLRKQWMQTLLEQEDEDFEARMKDGQDVMNLVESANMRVATAMGATATRHRPEDADDISAITDGSHY